MAVLFRDGWLLRRVVGKVGCHRPHPQHRRKLPDTFDAQPQDKKFIMADLSTAALTQLVQQLTPPGQWLLGPAARPLCLLPSAKTVFKGGGEIQHFARFVFHFLLLGSGGGLCRTVWHLRHVRSAFPAVGQPRSLRGCHPVGGSSIILPLILKR